MKGLTLIIPMPHVRPDYVVETPTHRLSLKADNRFKLRALFSRKWEVKKIKEYVAQHDVDTTAFIAIRDCTGKIVYLQK